MSIKMFLCWCRVNVRACITAPLARDDIKNEGASIHTDDARIRVNNTPSHTVDIMFDYSTVNVGDSIDGRSVKNIYYRAKKSLVYDTADGVRYAHRGLSIASEILIFELEELLKEAALKFRGAHRFALDDYKLMIAGIIYKAENHSVNLRGDIFSSLRSFIAAKPAVEHVYDTNPRFIVYLSVKKEVAFQVRSASEYDTKTFSEFHRLKAVASMSISGAKQQLFNYKIAAALIGALRSPEDANHYFGPVQEYLDKSISNKVGVHLVLSVFGLCFFAACVLGLIYWVSSEPGTKNLNMLLVGVSGGLVGAAISILQRSRDIRVLVYDSPGLIVLQAIARIALGCCFGVIATLASKAGLLFELFAGDYKRLFLLAILAGFSERMIPEFMEKTAKEKAE